MPINFSIIIPHKNIPQLLERCLQSIPQREDLQIIIVDDDSDPRIINFTPPHSLGYKHKNTEFYYTKEGKGAGYARNVGLSHAKGKWVIFADSDDFFTEEFPMVLDLYKDSDKDVILFPVRTVNSDSLENEEREPYFNEAVFNTTYSNQEKLSITVAPWSKFIKKSLIEDNNIFFEEIPYANDVMFSIKVAILANQITVDLHHYIYVLTVRNGSLTTINSATALFCRLNTAIRYNNYLKQHNHAEWMHQLNGRFLKWASLLGKKEVIRTIFVLYKSGFLFYKGKYAWKNKYYNDTWFHIFRSLLCRSKR